MMVTVCYSYTSASLRTSCDISTYMYNLHVTSLHLCCCSLLNMYLQEVKVWVKLHMYNMHVASLHLCR